MHDEMALEILPAATVRLVNLSWGNYLQKAFQQLKSLGQSQRKNGTEALIQRFRHVRPSSFQHSVRVAKFARETGRVFGLDESRLRQLSYTAVLHDAGKMFVPERILSSPRRPSRAELFLLHLHPSFGALLASYFNLPPELRVRTQHHHERWDGRGYPHGLSGEDIPFMARIVQVADTYDAMVSDPSRPYRKPLTHEEAVAELRKEGGKQFDPRVIEAFLDAFPQGTRKKVKEQ